MIAATYLSSTSCTITGEHDQEYPLGRKLKAAQGVDGTAKCTVVSASYSSGTGLTTIIIKESRFTANLVSIQKGPSDPSSMGQHYHDDEDDGAGYLPASRFTDGEVDSLAEIPELAVPDANKVIGETAAGTGWEKKAVVGVAKRVIVNHSAGQIQITGPQDIDTPDTPQFVSIKLSALTGILIANGTSAATALAISNALKVVRVNSGGTAFEVAYENIDDLYDVTITSAASGDILVRGAANYENMAKGTTRGYVIRRNSAGNVAWGDLEIITIGTAGETLAQYDIVYPDSVTGKWKKADADAEATSRASGIVVQSGGIANDATGEILLFGMVTYGSWTWTPMGRLYVSGTAGGMSHAAPAISVECGFALTATTVFFFPAGQGSSSNTETITAGETLAQYDAAYQKASDGKFYKAQADGTAEESNAYVIVTQSGGIAGDATGTAALPGSVITNGSWSKTKGADAWLSETAGSIDDSEPSAVYRKPMGLWIDTDALLFWPAPAWPAPIDSTVGAQANCFSRITDANTIQLFGIPGTTYKVMVNAEVVDLSSSKTIDTDSASDYLVSVPAGVATIDSTALSALTTGYNDYSILYVYLTNSDSCWNFSSPTVKDYRNSIVISQTAPTIDGYMGASGDGMDARHVGTFCLNSSRQMDTELSFLTRFGQSAAAVSVNGSSDWTTLTVGSETDCESLSVYIVKGNATSFMVLGKIQVGNEHTSNVATLEGRIYEGASQRDYSAKDLLKAGAGYAYRDLIPVMGIIALTNYRATATVALIKMTVTGTGASSTPQYRPAGSLMHVFRGASNT